MKKSIKLSIIATACFVALSLLIYSGIVMPNLQIMSQDEIVIEPDTEHSDGAFPFNFTPNAKDILTTCGKDYDCIVDSLKYVSKNENQALVLETYSDIINAFKQTGDVCHGFGHQIGMFLYSYTGNLHQVLQLIDRTCGGSIYHGVMQEYFKTNLHSYGDTLMYIVASNACDEIVDVSYSQIRSECVHGMGHGLVIANNYDFLTAIKKCGEFEDGLAQRSCVEGASMENVMAYSRNKGGTFDEHDVLFPCSVLDERYAEVCYHYHSGYILKKVNQSVEDAFKQCNKHQNENHVRHCYYGIGIMKAFHNHDKLENIISACQNGNLNYQSDCFAGAIYNIADHKGINQGFELCNLLPNMFKMDCYKNLGKWIHTIYFTEGEIENVCSQLKDAEYYQVCINANPEELGQL